METAVGMKLFLQRVVLDLGTLSLHPDGKGWNSYDRGWESSRKMELAIRCNCLVYSDSRPSCDSLISRPDHLMI